MKQVFGLLAALIFLWQRLNTSGSPLTPSNEADFLAPVTDVIWQISQELIVAILLAGIITLILSLLLNRWR